MQVSIRELISVLQFFQVVCKQLMVIIIAHYDRPFCIIVGQQISEQLTNLAIVLFVNQSLERVLLMD
ncbi:hypothetical protein D3C73_1534450 [compost metagenome]